MEVMVYYLYGLKQGQNRRLVATFDSEAMLRSYVHWATLEENPDGTCKFEQGSPLVGYTRFEHAAAPLTEDDPRQVVHDPSPSML